MRYGAMQGLPANPTDLRAKPAKEDEKWDRFCPLKCKSAYLELAAVCIIPNMVVGLSLIHISEPTRRY